MSNPVTKPNGYAHRLVPDYENPVVTIVFPNETSSQRWFEEIACKHAKWNKKQEITHEANPQFDGLDILLCHWHIKRAWESHTKKDFIVPNDTQGTKLLRNRVRASLNNMMYASTPEIYNLNVQFFLAQFAENTHFLDYFNKQWAQKSQLWSKAWRSGATFHTNNLIESYHNQLKTIYLGRSRSLRVDRLIYLLSNVVASDYYQEVLKTLYDFQSMSSNADDQQRKRLAHEIDYDTAFMMVEQIDSNQYQWQSFSHDILYYELEVKEGYLQNRTCPDNHHLCEHIFLVNRITNTPYVLHSPLINASSSSSNTTLFPATTTDINTITATRDTETIEQIDLCTDFKAMIDKYLNMYIKKVESKTKEFKDYPYVLDEILSDLKISISKLDKIGISPQAWPSRQQ